MELFLTLLTQHGRSVVCTEKTISSSERRFRLIKQEEEEEEESVLTSEAQFLVHPIWFFSLSQLQRGGGGRGGGRRGGEVIDRVVEDNIEET